MGIWRSGSLFTLLVLTIGLGGFWGLSKQSSAPTSKLDLRISQLPLPRTIAEEPKPSKWTKLTSGLWHLEWKARRKIGEPATPTHAFRVDPRTLQVTIINARRSDRDAATVRTLRSESGAYLVVNASFFDHKNRPLGLVIADGIKQSKLRNLDQGVFLISNGQPRIQGSREPLPEEIDMAVQSFPRLVVEGRPIRLKPKPSRRTILCVPGDGSLVIVIVAQAISLPDLARSLADPITSGGLGCWSALNLDGGSSTQASILTPALTLEVPGVGPVPNGLAVLPRSTDNAPVDIEPKL